MSDSESDTDDDTDRLSDLMESRVGDLEAELAEARAERDDLNDLADSFEARISRSEEERDLLAEWLADHRGEHDAAGWVLAARRYLAARRKGVGT